MISTKHKELAIEMWYEIRDNVDCERYYGKRYDAVDIEVFKSHFCREHNISWLCNCILCEEYRKNNCTPCSPDCPLMNRALAKGFTTTCGCSDRIETDFKVAMDEDCEYTLEERLKAIDNIINAIKEVQTVD